MPNATARKLRKTMTPHEVVLRSHLRRMKRHHFRRQAPIAGFIVDFVCFGSKLVVEVDGSQHGSDAHIARDRIRDARLHHDGFRVLRFWNSEIDENLDGVLAAIISAL